MGDRKPRYRVVPQPFPGQPFVVRKAVAFGSEVVQTDPDDASRAVAVFAGSSKECQKWVADAELSLEAGRVVKGLATTEPRSPTPQTPKKLRVQPAPTMTKKLPGHGGFRGRKPRPATPRFTPPARLSNSCDYCGARHAVEPHDPLAVALSCDACWAEEVGLA